MKKILKEKNINKYLKSAQEKEGVVSNKEFNEWYDKKCKNYIYKVEKIPIKKLREWKFTSDTGYLEHKSGKFFRVEGVHVRTNFGYTRSWSQPIINQPEIGILGILTKNINGLLHFLIQLKMEPGNINILQISPTVQATKSNYTKVHGGKSIKYLEYFLNSSKARIIVDQLQSEQGSRFLRKRNRNMIVEISENEKISIGKNFCWLTLGQILYFLKHNNMVNMDTRTVLSCIRYAKKDQKCDTAIHEYNSKNFNEDLFISSIANEKHAVHDFDDIISWITEMKTRYEVEVKRVPINQLKEWKYDGVQITHEKNRYFSVIGVSVTASDRENYKWDQPLIDSTDFGILCFICQKKNNILHFLVQARVEPGNLDVLELAPTLQCTPSNYDLQKKETLPPFYDIVTKANNNSIRYDVIQSEEGGRFYHDQNRYNIIEIDGRYELDLPRNYLWMTLRQIKEFIRFNNYFNIEARGLLSCLEIKMP
ncbi:hypothetical protein D3OALGA1CA_1446 [Olavius algarvensis associated proteobacterium Delta 3]|nr:hypothetical protein D3OALGA1CA_1446 [Olavius algarvensis associated proteobacterium Delta 3]